LELKRKFAHSLTSGSSEIRFLAIPEHDCFKIIRANEFLTIKGQFIFIMANERFEGAICLVLQITEVFDK
jgi:hypothetical protein